MAKKKYDSSEGIWRTIGGRRVFIRTGQSLSDAMKESGKFKKASDIKRETYQRENAYIEQNRTGLKFKKAIEERREIDNIIREKTYDENYADNSFFESSEYEKMKNRRGKLLDKEKKLTDEMNEYEKEYATRLYGARYHDHPKRYKGDISKLDGKHISNRKLSDVDKEWTDLAKKMEKDYDEFGTTNWQDEKRLNELSLERDTLSIKEDKFYTRKDGTKEYDPYKGTRFEKKYDSVEDALNDPNHPTRKYIDEKFKTNYTADEEDILNRYTEDYGYDGKDSLSNLKGQIDYMRNPRESINETAQRLVEGGDFLIYNEDIKQYLKERNIKFNDDNFFDVYKKEMADKIESLYNQGSLKEKYKGTVDYLKQTTNMNGSEILELLKKIDEDKK